MRTINYYMDNSLFPGFHVKYRDMCQDEKYFGMVK